MRPSRFLARFVMFLLGSFVVIGYHAICLLELFWENVTWWFEPSLVVKHIWASEQCMEQHVFVQLRFRWAVRRRCCSCIIRAFVPPVIRRISSKASRTLPQSQLCFGDPRVSSTQCLFEPSWVNVGLLSRPDVLNLDDRPFCSGHSQ